MKHLLWLVVAVFVCVAPLAAQDEAVTEKTVVRSYLDTVYSQMDLNGAKQMLAVDFVMHDTVWGSTDTNGYVTNFRLFYDEVSDLQYTPYTLISEGPLVVAAYLWEGQARTGLPVSGNGMEFFRVVDGKIAEIWRKVEQHDFTIQDSAEDYRLQLAEPELTDVAEMADNQSVVLRWIDAYSYGRLDTALMATTFTLHTCPCKSVGTIDQAAFKQIFAHMKESGAFAEWPQLLEKTGFLMASEGNLTAIHYQGTTEGSIPEGMAIFRLEDGRVAEVWTF